MSKKNVVVTGFGPFGDHAVNSSWQCAKELKLMHVEEELGIELIIEELPVIYDKVQEIVPRIWKDIKPNVVIHLGAHNDDCIKIECLARKGGYVKHDVSMNVPCHGQCPFGSQDSLKSRIDIEKLLEMLKKENLCNIQLSKSAGNYLCEFTYYLSLNEDPSRCLFVHVPPYKEKESVKTALQIKQIIKCALDLCSGRWEK